jgi:hypothetical protein
MHVCSPDVLRRFFDFHFFESLFVSIETCHRYNKCCSKKPLKTIVVVVVVVAVDATTTIIFAI